jgi:hypothetical protein
LYDYNFLFDIKNTKFLYLLKTMKTSILIFLVLVSYGSSQENLIGGVYAGYQGWFGSP